MHETFMLLGKIISDDRLYLLGKFIILHIDKKINKKILCDFFKFHTKKVERIKYSCRN